MKGLWRCHAGLQEIIWYALEGNHMQSIAYACQLSKAIHQVAIDNGDWSNALLLIPTPDALGEPSFGGEEEEMHMVQGWRRAMRDLKARQSGDRRGAGSDEDGKEEMSAAAKKKAEKRKAWLAKKKSEEPQR